MKYSKKEAKEFAFQNMKGIWAAALNPFDEELSMDERGLRSNLRHWIDDLEIDGFFVTGKQGEFFSMSIEERKKSFLIAVDECYGKAQTIVSCSDQNFDTVMELGKYAENIGADYIVVHAPVLNFVSDRAEVLKNYYSELSSKLNIGIAMWSHPDSGYLMEPELCNEIANLENIVAIKYSVPRDMYKKLTTLANDRIIVSTASESDWYENIVELDWKLYLCSSPPFLIQTKNDKRMKKYTDLAFNKNFKEAKVVRDSLDTVRKAFHSSKPESKPHAHQKYWQELLGQVGGRTRFPNLELTDEEKKRIKHAFNVSGLIK